MSNKTLIDHIRIKAPFLSFAILNSSLREALFDTTLPSLSIYAIAPLCLVHRGGVVKG